MSLKNYKNNILKFKLFIIFIHFLFPFYFSSLFYFIHIFFQFFRNQI